MKNNFKNLAIVFFTLAFSASFAQSNTFPNNGNVGIGTTNPQQKLHIHSAANQAAFVQVSGIAPGILFSPTQTNSLYVPGIGLSTSNTHYFPTAVPGDFNIRGGVNKDVLFGTLTGSSIDERMRIANNGYVGIGTTTPSKELHVEGRIYASRAIRNNSVKLGDNLGFLKLRRYNNGEDNVFKIALEPSTVQVSELLINSNGDFTNGTRIMGKGLIVDQSLSIGGATLQQGFDLAVKGKVIAEELKIRTFVNWPDYVFGPNYNLKTLSEVENHINQNGHLPNIPSATQVQKEGFDMAKMNALLLEKIEELTLHTIAQQKELELLKKQVNELTSKQ